MRIIAGEKRGTKLYTLEGLNTRPTLDRVKAVSYTHLLLYYGHLLVVLEW